MDQAIPNDKDVKEEMKHPSDIGRPGFEPWCWISVDTHAINKAMEILCMAAKNILFIK